MSACLHALSADHKGLLRWYVVHISHRKRTHPLHGSLSGAHDNGYTSTLNLLQNEGLLDKVVLLKGYKELAHEINNLRLPQLDIDGVFIQKKLQTNGKQKAAAANAAANKSPKPPKQPMTPGSSASESERTRVGSIGKPATPVAQIAKTATPVKKARPLDPEQVCGFRPWFDQRTVD